MSGKEKMKAIVIGGALLMPSIVLADLKLVDNNHTQSVTATTIAPLKIMPKEVPKFVIEKDIPIHLAIYEWAKNAGWTLIWYPPVSWKAISVVDLTDKKDVVAAVSEVITILRTEGKPVRLRVSDGNNVMEVLSSEIKND